MTLNEKTIEKIDSRKMELLKEMHRNGIGVHVDNSLKGVMVFHNNWEICTLEELTPMIEQLTILKQAIEEETGFRF